MNKKAKGEVYQRAPQKGWDQKDYVRLDVFDTSHKSNLHIYVPADHPFAKFAGAAELRIDMRGKRKKSA